MAVTVVVKMVASPDDLSPDQGGLLQIRSRRQLTVKHRLEWEYAISDLERPTDAREALLLSKWK